MAAAAPPSSLGAPRVKPSRYELLWDAHARAWEGSEDARRGRHLGDDWGTEEFVKATIDAFVAPYVKPDVPVLEIGPGGGRYTKHLLERSERVTALDCSSRMLALCARRFSGGRGPALVKGNGFDLTPVPGGSAGFACAFNVFVQLDLEDAVGYLFELARILTPGGAAAIHYADLSGPEGWSYFQANRASWSADPCQDGRFRFLTLDTMELLARRAGLAVVRNQRFGRDAVAVLRRVNALDAPPSAPGPLLASLDRHLADLRGDVHAEPPSAHHAAAARDTVDELLSGLDIRAALELGCGSAPTLDRLAERGAETLGVSLGGEPCAHRVLAVDMHATGLPDASFDLVVARHVVEHSPMPLLLLMEIARLTKRHALVVVPCDDEQWIRWPNHYSVLSKPLWRALFRRAGFRVAVERDGPLEPGSVEWRFLLERV